ncbi:DUF4880 domain-containing protein [Novosphingobium sp. BW1]|uniref:FecR family protein n=1 Tax=Novosphingobium sp. BW1 TaxID=2592621 RepID=UPI0011DEE396|nr:DUF4880 domain-containing protein [Novosphingobium sp. BW1]TYC89234.1 DUF4880 domain-containing protein [Novosphingobium sp. BW1]
MLDSPELETPGDDLIEDAARWLASLDAGSEDMRAFEAWRDADPRHAAAFAEVAGTWHALNDLKHFKAAPFAPAGPVTDAEVAEQDENPASSPTGSRRTLLRAGIGIGVLALAGGSFTYRAAARDMASTDIGQRRKIVSGTDMAVDLNTDSRIYWKDGAPLQLWLERGEIAIRLVAGNSLSLITQGGTFHLAAGFYNARLRDESCELTIIQGQGRLGDDPKILAAGETALATAGLATVRRDENEIDRVTSWRSGTLVLNGESLDYALAEMNRYLEHKIVIGDPGLSKLRIGGTFDTADPSEFLLALQTSFSIRTRRDGNGGVVLTRA